MSRRAHHRPTVLTEFQGQTGVQRAGPRPASRGWNSTSAAAQDSLCNTINLFAVFSKNKKKQVNHNRVQLCGAFLCGISARAADFPTESRYLCDSPTA